jgi:acetyltransferase-like isoleucine patch superfamily enzyme
MRRVITLLVFLLPACGVKNALLRCLHHSIPDDASIGSCLVDDVGRFDLGEGARIGVGNTFRGLTLVSLGRNAVVGQWNWIAAGKVFLNGDADRGVLRLGDHAAIVSRHIIDCAGGVRLEEYAILGGLRSVLITHQADYRTGTLTADGITIGAYSLVNSCNQFSPGAKVPARSVTALGAVIVPGLEAEGRLYGGVPARNIKAVEGLLFERTTGEL